MEMESNEKGLMRVRFKWQCLEPKQKGIKLMSEKQTMTLAVDIQ